MGCPRVQRQLSHSSCLCWRFWSKGVFLEDKLPFLIDFGVCVSMFLPLSKVNHWTAQLGIPSAEQASKHFYKSSDNRRCMSGQQIKHLKGITVELRSQPLEFIALENSHMWLGENSLTAEKRMLRASSSSSSSGAAGQELTTPISGLV